MLEFEWDDDKAEGNLRKHGVAFEDAARAFGDPMLIELDPFISPDGEIRFSIVAGTKGLILFVAYAERHSNIRIISARRATTHERRRYEEDPSY